VNETLKLMDRKKKMEQAYPKRPDILDEYSWNNAKKIMFKDENIWWQIRSYIASIESLHSKTENLLQAILQQISHKDKFQTSFSKEYLSEIYPLILESKNDWEEVKEKFNACVWFELLQYSKTIEVMYESINRIVEVMLSELYEHGEKGKKNGNDTEEL